MENIPILFPVEPNEFWKQLKVIISEILVEQKILDRSLLMKANDKENILLKIPDVCQFFGVSKVTIHQWMKEGKLNSFKINSRRYFLKIDIENLVEKFAHNEPSRK